jgi:hypothetical protein
MKSLILILLAALQLAAQSSEIVRVQNQRPDAIYKLLMPMIPEGTRVAYDNQLKVITIGGQPSVIEMLVKNIARLDVAPSNKSVALTVHLVLGSQDAAGKLPNELSAVEKQLHAVFPFKGYQLLDTTVMWSTDGASATTGGSIPSAGDEQAATYQIRFESSAISGDGTATQVSLRQFDFNSRFPLKTILPGNVQMSGANLRADLVIGDGKKVVVGKTTLGTGKESIFVVLSAKVTN